MNAVTYFSTNNPEKVTRVAAYFYNKLAKQVKNKKFEHVDVASQALEYLLASSPARSYKMFAECFLLAPPPLMKNTDKALQQATRSVGTQTSEKDFAL